MMRFKYLLVLLCLSGNYVLTQDSEHPETLINGDIDNGFVFSFDDKLSTIDGDFANFAGAHIGWLINHKFLIAVAGYGTTDAPHGLDMGYGGCSSSTSSTPTRPSTREAVIRCHLRGQAPTFWRSPVGVGGRV